MGITATKSIASYKIDYRERNPNEILKSIIQCFPMLDEAKREKFAILIRYACISKLEVSYEIGIEKNILSLRITTPNESYCPKIWWAEWGRLGVTQILTQDDKTYTLVFDI